MRTVNLHLISFISFAFHAYGKRYFPEATDSGAGNREKAFLAAPAHLTHLHQNKGPSS